MVDRKKNYISLVCPQCGRLMHILKSIYRQRMIKTKSPICCSVQCSHAWRKAQKGKDGKH